MTPQCPRCHTDLPPNVLIQFCPQCGHSLTGAAPARLSTGPSAWVQTLDRLWDFFASTRVAVVLIFVIAVASIAGSLVEQEHLYNDWRPPELYYPNRYGPNWGPLLMRLGLTHAYTSAWFVSLLFLLIVSLIICSLQRLVPLWRALHHPQGEKSPAFVRRQALVGATGPLDPQTDPLSEVATTLRRKGYGVVRTGSSLYAERGRLGRYGPYVIHIGLIIAALAGAARMLPGWEVTHDLWVADGQTMKIPGTALAFKNNKYTMELYPSGMPKFFRTDGVVLENGQEVKRKIIEVNRPLAYGGWDFFQASWKNEPGIAHFNVVETQSGQVLGRMDIDLKTPEQEYPLGGGFRMRIDEYFSDFGVDEQNQFVNRSREIANPVFRLSFLAPSGATIGNQALLVAVNPQMPNPDPIGAGPLRLDQTGVTTRWYTGIKVHRDRSVPFMFLGLSIIMWGMVQTFFLHHRQLWAALDGGCIVVGGQAHKGRFALKQEIRLLTESRGGGLL